MKAKNEILIGNCNYYLIRLGTSGDKKSDFIDHIDYPYNISIAHFADDELILIQGPNIDFCVENEAVYGEWVEKVTKKIIKK